THMESSARAPERSLRKCLAHALDGKCTRSAGCLDRLTIKGMNTFPPPSSLEAKASRCLLFEQLLNGGRRKQERLLVPDLATNWFRKQKVYVDKLSVEELADLGSGLASQNKCYELQYSCGCHEERKCPEQMRNHQNCGSCCGCQEAAETQATQNAGMVSQCLPTTEPKSRNPFLLTREPTMEEKHIKCLQPRDTNDGNCYTCQESNDRSTYNRLLQAMGRSVPSKRRSEPIQPRLRRKYDLRQAPQRRLDPTAFRRISPEFFCILDAYETAMSESCPLYGISMHHWGETTEFCPCEEQSCTWEKQHFLGDDSVATTMPPTYRLPGPNHPPEEWSEREDMQQVAHKKKEKEKEKSRKVLSASMQKNHGENAYLPCDDTSCPAMKSNHSYARSGLDEQRQLDIDTEEQQKYLKQQQQELEQHQKELKQQQMQLQQQRQQQLKQQQQELQKQQKQLQQQQQQLEQKLGAMQGRPKVPKKRRDWRNCFRQAPVSKYTLVGVNGYIPAEFLQAPLARLPPTFSLRTASSFTPASSVPPDSSFPPASFPPTESLLYPPLSSGYTLPNGSNQEENIRGNCSSLSRRVSRPLYDLGSSFHRSKYARKQENKVKRRQPQQVPKLFDSVPAPCTWKKVKKPLPPEFPETEMQAEDSSTTLTPPVHDSNTQLGIGGEREYDEKQQEGKKQKEEHREKEQEEVKHEQEQHQVAEHSLPEELPKIPPNEQNIHYHNQPSERTLAGFADLPEKQSTDSDYAKCGYKPRAFYLSNDYFQLMRRVARPRPSKERLRRKKAPDQVITRAKQNICKDQCQTKPKDQFQFKPKLKPKTYAKPKAKMPSICLKSAIERARLSYCRPAKPKKIIRMQCTKTLPEDPPPAPEDPCCCGCLDIIQDQAPIQTETPLTICEEYTECPMYPEPSSSGFFGSQYTKQGMIPPCSQPETSPSSQPATSPSSQLVTTLSSQQVTSTSSLPKTPVACCTPMIPSRKPSIRKCMSTTQTSTTYSVETPPQERTPTRKMRSRSRTPTRRRERISCYCSVSCAPQEQAYSITATEATSSFAPSQPASSFVVPEHMVPGRRCYTDTQMGTGVRPKYSCRSLHTTCSIRALSSNTDSLRCPCAPAPSVASVVPPPANIKEELVQQYYQYPKPQPQPEMLEMPQQEPYLQQRQQKCPARLPPPTFKLFSNKPSLFKNTLRWEEQEHRYARTRLRTNRPFPPPRQDEFQVIKRNQVVGWQLVEQRTNYNNHKSSYCPEENYQQWGNEPYYTQQCQTGQEARLRNQPYPNGFAYQQHFTRCNAPRTEQNGAIAAAAQGLRGLVQALGGPRHRAQHCGKVERRDDHQGRDYSQEMMDPASQSYYTAEEAMGPQEDFSYRTGTSYMCSDNTNYESITSGGTQLEESMTSERTWSSMEASPPRLGRGITAERSARERRRGSDSGALISFDSGMDFRSNPSTSQRIRCEHQRHRQAGGSSPVNRDRKERRPGPKPTPLAIFLDELRAKHDATQNLSRSRPNQTEPKQVDNTAALESSFSDDCADADDSLETRHRPSKGKTMVIPATYTGLLEEQVISEYLPRPSYKRRT
ncbi:hypothetical protein KR038_011526, partial [Drosophila bunnanda]